VLPTHGDPFWSICEYHTTHHQHNTIASLAHSFTYAFSSSFLFFSFIIHSLSLIHHPFSFSHSSSILFLSFIIHSLSLIHHPVSSSHSSSCLFLSFIILSLSHSHSHSSSILFLSFTLCFIVVHLSFIEMARGHHKCKDAFGVVLDM
jgi:hypothetical protein